MNEKITPWIEGKRVLLLGFGREGQSTYHVIKQAGGYACLDIADMASPAQRPDEEARWITGPGYQKCMDDYDVVFKSPGIVLEKPIEEYRCQILSQTEVFFQCFRDQLIGITGTKGKSTVTSLLSHILKNAGMDTMILGNIGIPALDHMEEVKPDTKIVFELSCHQLEYMTVSPHIGILVNIHEEHLDHYKTMEKYVEAKQRIFRNQKKDDILICNVQCLPESAICPSTLLKAGVNEPDTELCVAEEPDGTWIHFRDKAYRIPVTKSGCWDSTITLTSGWYTGCAVSLGWMTVHSRQDLRHMNPCLTGFSIWVSGTGLNIMMIPYQPSAIPPYRPLRR